MFFNFNTFLHKVTRKPHGIHSPFLYSLLNTCLFEKPSQQEYRHIVDAYYSQQRFKARKTSLLFSYPLLRLRSRMMNVGKKHENRTFFFKQPSFSFYLLLYRVVRFLNPRVILATNNSSIAGLDCLAKAAPFSIINIYGDPRNDSNSYASNCGSSKYSGLRCNHENEIFVESVAKVGKVDFALLDPTLTPNALKKLFFETSKQTNPEGVILIEGIRTSKAKKQTWLEIANAETVTMVVDFYDFGMVFFNRKLSKQVVRVGL